MAPTKTSSSNRDVEQEYSRPKRGDRARQLHTALGADPVLSGEQVAVLAGTAQARLHPAR